MLQMKLRRAFEKDFDLACLVVNSAASVEKVQVKQGLCCKLDTARAAEGLVHGMVSGGVGGFHCVRLEVWDNVAMQYQGAQVVLLVVPLAVEAVAVVLARRLAAVMVCKGKVVGILWTESRLFESLVPRSYCWVSEPRQRKVCRAEQI